MCERELKQIQTIFNHICTRDKYISEFNGGSILTWNNVEEEEFTIIVSSKINGNIIHSLPMTIRDSDYHNFSDTDLYSLFQELTRKNISDFLSNLK